MCRTGNVASEMMLQLMKPDRECFNPLMYSAFAIELSDLSKPFMFARLKGFERLENCLTKGTYERF